MIGFCWDDCLILNMYLQCLFYRLQTLLQFFHQQFYFPRSFAFSVSNKLEFFFPQNNDNNSMSSSRYFYISWMMDKHSRTAAESFPLPCKHCG